MALQLSGGAESARIGGKALVVPEPEMRDVLWLWMGVGVVAFMLPMRP